MADWLVDVSTDPRRFPVISHRHVNGVLRAERDRTPQVVTTDAEGRRVERWTFACACGEVTSWERRSGGAS